jgi:siroheme synthase
MVLTSHHASKDADPWPEHIPSNVTLVVYMPGYAYEETRARLVKAGLSSRTPLAVISQASSPREQVFRTTIANLHLAPRLPAPTLLVVGDVVRFADHATLRRQAERVERRHKDILPLSAETDSFPEKEEQE